MTGSSSSAGRRLWIFRVVVPLAAPVVFLLLVEVVLRLAGFGDPAPAVLRCEVDGRPAYCSNPSFGRRFFPRPLAKQFLPFSIPAERSDDTYRIVVLGGSAAHGTPDPGFAFGRILEVLLEERYPGVHFDVINAAIMASNSHVARVIVRDLNGAPVDAFAVYMGNNEVVGPYGPGTGFTSMFGGTRAIRMHVAFRATRTGQLLARLVERVGGGVPNSGGELERLLLQRQVRSDDPRLDTAYRNFESNLEDIVGTAHRRGSTVVLCTLSCNLLDHAPFASQRRPGMSEAELRAWQESYDSGVRAERAGDPAGAVERYVQAERIDATFADLHYRLARCYAALGRWDDARERYARARDLSTLRFRPSEAINDAIRAVAASTSAEGTRLAEVAEAFVLASPHGIPGNELFHDHVHPTFAGNYLIAREVLGQIEAVLPESILSRRAREDVPSEQECADALAFTPWDALRHRRIMLEGFFKRALFPNQMDHDRHIAELERELRFLEAAMSAPVLQSALATYRRAMVRNPDDRFIQERFRELLQESRLRGLRQRGGRR